MISTVKSSVFYLAQTVFSGLLSLALMPVISQYLSPSDFGVFVLAQVYSGILAGIANLGMLTGYERNFFVFEKSRQKTAELASSAVVFVGLNLLALMFLIYIFQSQISSLVFQDFNTPDNMFFIVAVGASLSSLSQYYLTFMKNSGLFKRYVSCMITNSLTYFVISTILMAYSGMGVMSLAYAWLMSSTILLLLVYLSVGRRLSRRPNVTMLKEMLKISIPLTPRIFFGAINTQFDKILLGLIGSSSLVGVYHMGQVFAMTIFQFMTALGKVFQPEVYRKLFANKHINNPGEINQYLLPFFYVSIFFAILLVLLVQQLVVLLLSGEYQEATLIVIILSIYYASMFIGKITGAQLIFAKKTHITTLLMLVGIVINVGLNIPFIINWGIVGAAWATTISGIIMTIVGYFVAKKYVTIDWNRKKIFTVYGLFFTAVIFSMLDYHHSISPYISTLLKLLLILAYVAAGILLKAFPIREIRNLF